MALIAQLGEHCTGMAKVVGSKPAQSLNFFSGLCSSSVTAALALITVITQLLLWDKLLSFDWCVYFSRPIRFSRTLVCGLFKNPWFSCGRYFKVLFPILLVASPLAFSGSAVKTLFRAPTIPPATQATIIVLSCQVSCFYQKVNDYAVLGHNSWTNLAGFQCHAIQNRLK